MNGTKTVTRGLSIGHLAVGAFFAAAGIIFIAMAFFGHYTLSFHRIILPQWVFYVVAGISFALGSYGIRQSFRTWKCASCDTVLQYGEAYYPSEFESQVMRSYESMDASGMVPPPPPQKRTEWIKLSLDFCDKCGRTGVLSVTKENMRREKNPIGKPKIIAGASVASFLQFVKLSTRIDPLDLDV